MLIVDCFIKSFEDDGLPQTLHPGSVILYERVHEALAVPFAFLDLLPHLEIPVLLEPHMRRLGVVAGYFEGVVLCGLGPAAHLGEPVEQVRFLFLEPLLVPFGLVIEELLLGEGRDLRDGHVVFGGAFLSLDHILAELGDGLQLELLEQLAVALLEKVVQVGGLRLGEVCVRDWILLSMKCLISRVNTSVVACSFCRFEIRSE